ncbi:hypothetical protein [Clostridium sp. M14]|uniref:hypothetical protein n=1 Tax=Clostridium sp. M14 TaxID=2716311 RepID=UPI0013EE49FE|nr:hypothetical protein [Clostridium sp. M14]MBZ9693304.1 hypothetical protein [Clostridium sp. M14]
MLNITDKDYDLENNCTYKVLKDDVYDKLFNELDSIIKNSSKDNIFGALLTTAPDNILVDFYNNLNKLLK